MSAIRPWPVRRPDATEQRRVVSRGLMRLVVQACLFVLVSSMISTTVLPEAVHAETRAEARAERDGAPSRLVERWQEATPAERRAIRARARDRFEAATPGQRRRMLRRLRRLERALPDFSPIERLLLLRAAAELPREEQESLRERVGAIDDLEPAERKQLIGELEGLIRAFDGEAERIERNRERWEGMSEAEREEYRAQMKRLRSMSVEERRALFEEMERSKRGAKGKR